MHAALSKLAARIGLASTKRDDSKESLYTNLRALTPLADDVARRVAPYLRTRARGRQDALRKIGMELQFDTPEAAQKHQAIRGTLQGAGGLAGAALGARAGMRRGLGGALAGAALGGIAGHSGTGVAFDASHDIPQRTMGGFDATQQRLHAAGGMPSIKFAAGEFSSVGDEFELFARQEFDDALGISQRARDQTVFEHDKAKKEQSPPWASATGPMPDGALASTLPAPSAV